MPRENAGEHPPRERRFLGAASKLAASKEILLKRRRAMAVLCVPGYGDLLLRSDVRQGNTLATRMGTRIKTYLRQLSDRVY